MYIRLARESCLGRARSIDQRNREPIFWSLVLHRPHKPLSDIGNWAVGVGQRKPFESLFVTLLTGTGAKNNNAKCGTEYNLDTSKIFHDQIAPWREMWSAQTEGVADAASTSSSAWHASTLRRRRNVHPNAAIPPIHTEKQSLTTQPGACPTLRSRNGRKFHVVM